MMASISSFSQSDEIEEMELQQLDEVVLTAYSSERTGCGMTCTYVTVIDYSYSESSTALYPNPSSTGFFNLKFTKNYKKVTVNAYTMTGQFVLSEKIKSLSSNMSVDLSQSPKGIYLLEIIADGVKLPTKKAVSR